MKILDLEEARKNPEQNPKTSINDIVATRLENVGDSVAGTKNLFVSFTKLDKLGINPGSKYGTPVGIYAYPAEYVVDQVGEYLPMQSLPFAGDAPYLNMFSVSGNIINLSRLSEKSVFALLEKVAHVLAEAKDISVDRANDIVYAHWDDSDHQARIPDAPGGRFWYVMWALTRRDLATAWGNQPQVGWTRLMRAIGVDGCVDDAGIIHENEPTQAVFFNPGSMVDVSRHLNKYNPRDSRQAVSLGKANAIDQRELATDVRALTNKADALNWFRRTNQWFGIRYILDREIRDHVLLNSEIDTISVIPNPTPRDQLMAMIGSGGDAIEWIARPDEGAVIEFLARQDPRRPYTLDHFFNTLVTKFNHKRRPSKQLQRAIVDHDHELLKQIDIPHADTIRHVLTRHADQLSNPDHAYGLPLWVIKKARDHKVDISEYKPRRTPHRILDLSNMLKRMQEDVADHQMRIDELATDWAKVKDSQMPEHLIQDIYSTYQSRVAAHQKIMSRLTTEMADIQRKIADYERIWASPRAT